MPAPTTKLYDLNDDCLLSIFNYLDRYDLFKLVSVCDRFHNLGRETYVRNFKKEKISISLFHPTLIYDSMQLLCRFGDCVPNLKVTVCGNKVNGLFKILENCRNNLTELFVIISMTMNLFNSHHMHRIFE